MSEFRILSQNQTIKSTSLTHLRRGKAYSMHDTAYKQHTYNVTYYPNIHINNNH